MASFPHISTFHFFSSNKVQLFSCNNFKLFSPPFRPLKLHTPRIHSCAIKLSPRVTRKVKSNAELCNDIRDFLSGAGLPEDHVPSLKELSQHGRQDLANIVRRRGYKVIKELLSVSTGTSLNNSDFEETSSEIQGLRDSEDQSTGQNNKMPAPAGDVLLSKSLVMMKNHKSFEMDIILDSNDANYGSQEVSVDESLQQQGLTFTQNGSEISTQKEQRISLSDDVYLSSTAATQTELDSNKQSYDDPEASSYSALKEKAANFVYNGQLDTIEDSGFSILSITSSEDASVSKSQNALESRYDWTSRDPDEVTSGADGIESSNGDYVEVPMVDSTLSGKDSLSAESASNSDHSKDLNVEAEIARLKFILHEKEMELTRLKQEIENEKLSLSHLQTKAEMEISKAHQLIFEKDAELQAAEESLSGLIEVEIQYLGDGEVVEVCGSFNGWHDKIKMDPKQSSNIVDSSRPRKSHLWAAILWLYPGVYEIKFVVDGHWKVDPHRESVVKGSIHNNILRVDP